MWSLGGDEVEKKKRKKKKKRKGESILIVWMKKIEEWKNKLKIKIEKWYYNIFIINKVVIAYY